MIQFSDIYERTVNLIDDPDINRAYLTNTIEFQKIMYNFLINGLSYITHPIKVTDALAQYNKPTGETEVGACEAGKQAYNIEMDIPEDAEVVFYIDTPSKKGVLVKQQAEAAYDATDKTVTFVKPVSDGEQYEIEWYKAGEFTADFTQAGAAIGSSMTKRVIEILARTTVIAWAEKEQNFLLDIRNLLNDTDFKLHSPANSLKTKTEWVNSLQFEIYSLQNRLDWDLRNRSVSWYGY
mgnify:FL=1